MILGSVPPAALFDRIPEDVRALLPGHVTFADMPSLGSSASKMIRPNRGNRISISRFFSLPNPLTSRLCTDA